MILPSKHISEGQALIGVGAVVLHHLVRPETVTSLWDKVRNDRAVGTYERFILALDLLYITGILNLAQGMIRREAK